MFKEPESDRIKPGEVCIFQDGPFQVAMAWCPPGTFTMGSPKTEDGRFPNEVPHTETLSRGFWLGQTQVTQAQWRLVIGGRPSADKGGDKPVESVRWGSVLEFIDRLNKKVGKPVYRLPKEAEWEYACRAGTTTPFHTGDNLTTDQANFKGHNYRRGTIAVGQLAHNAWNLYDMHGNVRECCNDWFGNPPDKTDPFGLYRIAYRVTRGGSYFDEARFCRSAYRDKINPDYPSSHVGFRLLRISE